MQAVREHPTIDFVSSFAPTAEGPLLLERQAFAVEDRAGVALGPVIVNQCFAPLPAGVTADAAAITTITRNTNTCIKSQGM